MDTHITISSHVSKAGEPLPKWMQDALDYKPIGVPVLDACHGTFIQGLSREFMIERGRSYVRDDSAVADWLGSGDLRGEQKMCFRNAAEDAMAHSDLTYVEGWAMPESVDMPMAHAWLVDEAGNVIDATWRGGYAYHGVPFETAEVCRLLLAIGRYGFVSSLWDSRVRAAMGL